MTADEVVRLLNTMGGENVSAARVAGEASCVPGQTHLVLDGVDGTLPTQASKIVDERLYGGRLLRLSGGSLLSAQWAAYDLLRKLGVRFFHPEQTFIPEALSWPTGSTGRCTRTGRTRWS